MGSSPGQMSSLVKLHKVKSARYVSYLLGLLFAFTHLDADKNLVQVTVQVRRHISNVLKIVNVLGNFINTRFLLKNHVN